MAAKRSKPTGTLLVAPGQKASSNIPPPMSALRAERAPAVEVRMENIEPLFNPCR